MDGLENKHKGMYAINDALSAAKKKTKKVTIGRLPPLLQWGSQEKKNAKKNFWGGKSRFWF